MSDDRIEEIHETSWVCYSQFDCQYIREPTTEKTESHPAGEIRGRIVIAFKEDHRITYQSLITVLEGIYRQSMSLPARKDELIAENLSSHKQSIKKITDVEEKLLNKSNAYPRSFII